MIRRLALTTPVVHLKVHASNVLNHVVFAMEPSAAVATLVLSGGVIVSLAVPREGTHITK